MIQTDLPQGIATTIEELNLTWRGLADLTPSEAAAKVETSHKAYRLQIQSQVAAVSAEADSNISQAYQSAQEACARQDNNEFRIQRQTILKSLLHACYVGAKDAMEAGDAQGAAPWLGYIQQMAKWDEDNDTVAALKGLQENRVSLDTARPIILRGMLDWYAGQIKHEAEEALEALEKGRLFQALLEAVEAVVYLRPIKADLPGKLGAERAQEVVQTVQQFHDIARAGDAERITVVAKKLESLLS
jgi:hypothetical protein